MPLTKPRLLGIATVLERYSESPAFMTIGPSVGPAGTLKTSEKLKSTKTSSNFFLYIK
jgi:hypothetical protein